MTDPKEKEIRMRRPLSQERAVALSLMGVYPSCLECAHYGLNLIQDEGRLSTHPECMLHVCFLEVGEDVCDDFEPEEDSQDSENGTG